MSSRGGRKSDDKEIAAFVDLLAEQPWLDASRRQWPYYLFHLTDIQNIPSIAAEGQLISRQRVQAVDYLKLDCASPGIIAQTPAEYQDCVRLYFRPRTPTFFRNEGMRPLGQRKFDAHMPIPVAMLFDSKQVLGLQGSRFSNGSLARPGAATGTGVGFLSQLPFQRIYHDTYIPQDLKEEIVFHRHAEVFVPERLSLDSLRHIYVRSVAERETLMTLLRRHERGVQPVYQRVKALVRINSRRSLFFNRWTYVERVDVTENSIRFVFNPSSETPGPYRTEVMLKGLRSNVAGHTLYDTIALQQPLIVQIPKALQGGVLRCKLLIDSYPAYDGTLEPEYGDLLQVPF